MAQGLILLVLIAALIAFLTTKVRRRMGLAVTGKTWTVVMVGAAVIVLLLWDASQR